MKIRLYVLLFCLGCCGMLQAQNREIAFESLTFNEALQKAAGSKKMLFVDCYTSWCEPCKLMAKQVFTIDSIADFFNANLVSLKMDMEKGEGLELAKRWNVGVFPAFLLFDGKGREIYRMVGQKSASTFMRKIKEGMDPDNSILLMSEAYQAGRKEAAFIYRYAKALKGASMDEQLEQVVSTYFAKMDVKQICRDGNWKIYDEFVSGISTPLFRRLIDEVDQFKALKGDDVIVEKLNAEFTKDLFQAISGEMLTGEQYEQYGKDIEKIGLKDAKQLFYLRSYLHFAHLRAERKYDEILDLIEAGPEGYDPERKSTLAMSLYFMADGTVPQRQRAEDLLLREAQHIMAEAGGRLPGNLEQVIGYVQMKLRQGVPATGDMDSLYVEFQKQYVIESERLGEIYPYDFKNVDSTVVMLRKKHSGLIRFIQYSGLPVDTIAMLQVRATMNTYSALINMENSMRWLAKIDTILPDSYYFFAGTLNLNTPVWKELDGVYPFLDSYFGVMERVGKLKSNGTDYLLHRAELMEDAELRENYLMYVLQKEVGLGYWEKLPEIIASVDSFVTSEANRAVLEDLRRKHNEMAEQFAHLNRGGKAGELSGKDRDGKKYTLRSLRGKVVVIDVWSTACLPCIDEMSYLDRLEKQFAGKEVMFISYSIDRNRESWMKFLQEKNRGGVQLIDTGGAKSSFVQYYAIHSTPRLILIGRDGKIADSRGPKPSNPLLAEEIEKLLGE